MVVFKRSSVDGKYACEYELMPLELAANTERKVPVEWITEDGTMLSDDFVDYALP